MTERFSWRFYICVLSNIYKEKHIIFTGKMIILELILVSDKFVVQSLSHVLCDSLRPQGLQHVRLPCPSPTPRACSNSCPLSQLCRPTISSSFVPFSSCLQSFPASGSFQMSQFFASGGQSIGVSASGKGRWSKTKGTGEP